MNRLEEENKKLKEQISNFEDLKLKFITKSGMVKIISWGNDYKKWPVENQLEYAEALASAMNDACDIIQKERNEWQQKALKAEEALIVADKAIDNQRTNNINSITKANAAQQEMIKALRVLEKEKEELTKRNEELTNELNLITNPM